jgi:peptidyl-prolyl cis-trans isomerase D
MLRGLSLTEIVTKHDIDEQLRLDNQKRDVGYALIPMKRYMDAVDVTDDDIKAMYEKHREQYQTPERMTINYIDVSVDDLAASQKVTEAQLREYYENNKLDYQVDKVAELAEKLLKQIRAGESFAELAKQYSKDPGTAAKGGDLGYFGRNVMDKAFEDAVFSMKVGEVRGPIHTSFGEHIIKLTGIKGDQRRASHILLTKDDTDKSTAAIQPFEAVRERVEKSYRHKLAEKQFADVYDQLNNLTYENPTTLDVAADELKLKVKTSEAFGRGGGTGILANPKVISAAFSDDVLNQGNNSELLELSDTHVVVLRKHSYSKPAPRPLEDVRQQVINQVRTQKATEKAKQVGKEILAHMLKGDSFVSLAKDYAFDWKKPGLIDRNNKDVDSVLVKKVFQMPKPVNDKPVYEGMALRSGDYALIGLFSVAEGDTSKQDETARSKAQAALLQTYRQNEQNAFKAQLKEQADIETFPANL